MYKAKLNSGEVKTFIDLDDAINWLLTKMDFTMYEYQKLVSTYEYNGIIFNSKEEFRNYVFKNMEVKNG